MNESQKKDTSTITSPSTVHDSMLLSIRGQGVSVGDSLVGVVVGSEVHAQDSLVIVGVAKTIAGDARILVEGRSLLRAALVGTVLFAFIYRLLRRR